MNLRSLQLALAAPLLLALVACSEDDDSAFQGKPVPLAECPDLDYSTCDVREPSCQVRLLSIAQCVVGAEDAPRVPIAVLTEDELRAELEAEAEADTPEDLAERKIIEEVLHDLDLAAVGSLSVDASIDNLLESFDGMYRDAERGITLIDRGDPQDSIEANALLVHELVHAIQDAQYDLDGLLERFVTSSDSQLALKALIEGEATWYQYRVVTAMLGYHTADIDFIGTFADLRQDLLADAKGSSSPFIAAFGTFPYAFGTNIAYEAWLEDGRGFEAKLLDAPPLTTYDIIDRSLDLGATPVTARSFTEPVAADGFTLLDQDSFGTFLLELCFYKKGLSSVPWRGDHLWIYTDESGAPAWLWEIEIGRSAADIGPAFEITLPADVTVEAEGNRLFVVSNAELAPFLLDAGRSFLAETN